MSVGCARRRWSGEHGFTLAEMLVVLAILALTAAVATPALRSIGGAASLERTAVQVAALARSARMEAVGRNRESVLAFATDGRRFMVEGVAQPVGVDDTVEVAVVAAETEVREGEAAQIRFFADGTSTGGAVTLSAEGRVSRVRVDWLTGAVRIVREEPPR